MVEKCWEILHGKSLLGRACKGCSAYLENKNCWEVENTPCSESSAVCILIKCPVYESHKEEIENALLEELRKKELLELDRQLEAIHERKCWEIRKCPAEIYKNCPAFKKREVNCWELDECSCKLRALESCNICPIYLFHVRFREK